MHVTILRTLHKHNGLNNPLEHPQTKIITMIIGKTNTKKNFLIFYVHRNSKKQGKL